MLYSWWSGLYKLKLESSEHRGKKIKKDCVCQINSPEEEMSMKRFVKVGAQDLATDWVVGDALASVWVLN